MATWVDDIIQALKNLGGQATNNEIFTEVKKIRNNNLPKTWQAMIIKEIGLHFSGSDYFNGNELFRKVDRGVWALKDLNLPQQIKHKDTEQNNQNFTLPNSFEEITNLLKTIKEYRDYTNPDSPLWKEYIKEFFHLLGFSTEENSPRLIVLKDMGANDAPKAIVGYIHPGENFTEIIPGLNWESHLLFAANYFHVEWGILTNGLQLKVIDYQHRDDQPTSYSSDLDGIIRNEKLDSFFTIYKVFSIIKGSQEDKPKPLPIEKRPPIVASQRMSKGLTNIVDVYREIIENNFDFSYACKIVAQRNNLSEPTTIADACTRRIGIKTPQFKRLITNRAQFIEYLIGQFPDFTEEIKKEIDTVDDRPPLDKLFDDLLS